MSYDWNELKYNNYNFNFKNFNGGLSLRKINNMINIIKYLSPEIKENKNKM